jgi:hypothetical protein
MKKLSIALLALLTFAGAQLHASEPEAGMPALEEKAAAPAPKEEKKEEKPAKKEHHDKKHHHKK